MTDLLASDDALSTAPSGGTPPRYLAPSFATRRFFNGPVAWLTKRGLSFWGSRVLEVRGRRSGEWRSVPVNLLAVGDHRYLVAPRGQTQWVRNLRASGEGRLRVGRRVEEFTATELTDAEKPAILRAYLERWKWEVGQFFDGVDAQASDDELLAIAPGHPVFRIASRRAR